MNERIASYNRMVNEAAAAKRRKEISEAVDRFCSSPRQLEVKTAQLWVNQGTIWETSRGEENQYFIDDFGHEFFCKSLCGAGTGIEPVTTENVEVVRAKVDELYIRRINHELSDEEASTYQMLDRALFRFDKANFQNETAL